MSHDDNKRILKNTVALYIRMFLVMAVSLYTSRVVLNQLGVTDYGIYNVVGGVVALLGFFNGSITAATQRFIAIAIGKKDETLENRTFNMALVIHIVLACVLLLFAETVGLWFVKNKLVVPHASYNSALIVYHFSIASAIIGIVSVPFTAATTAHEKMTAYAYMSIFECLLKLAVAFLLMLIDFNKLTLYAGLLFLSSLFVTITWVIYNHKVFPTCRIRPYWNKFLFKEIVGFVGWQTLGSIALILRTQGVNIVLNMAFGPIMNAARGIAVTVNGAALQFVGNFQTAVVPQITKSYAAHEMNKMHNLIIRSSKLNFILLFIIAMPLLMETEPILKLWLKIIPKDGVIFTQLILITTLTDLLSGTLVFGALATGKIRNYQLFLSSLFASDIVLVYLGFKLGLPATSLFFVETILNCVALIGRLIFLRAMIGLNIRKFLLDVTLREFLTFIIVFVFCILTKSFLPVSIIGVVLCIIISILIASIGSYSLCLNNQERVWFNMIFKNTMLKFISKQR